MMGRIRENVCTKMARLTCVTYNFYINIKKLEGKIYICANEIDWVGNKKVSFQAIVACYVVHRLIHLLNASYVYPTA